tara:strand:- start:468 stop:578 length:111 start_codon:yes stop_codon:yes gene_type:complete
MGVDTTNKVINYVSPKKISIKEKPYSRKQKVEKKLL